MLSFNPLSTVKHSHIIKIRLDKMSNGKSPLEALRYSDPWAPLTTWIPEALGHSWAWLFKKMSNNDKICLIQHTSNQTHFALCFPPRFWNIWVHIMMVLGMKPKFKHMIHIWFHTHTCTYRLKGILCRCTCILTASCHMRSKVKFSTYSSSMAVLKNNFQFCIWNLKILMQRI